MGIITGKTHFIGGVLAGVLLTQALDINIGYAAISGIGALFPDIDEPNSTIGRRIPGSFLVKFLFGHRGFWHSLLAAALLYLILLGVASNAIAVLFVAGYISHLLLDACTPSGVPFLYPIKRNYSLNLIKTGGIIEHAFLVVMLTALFFTTGGIKV